MTTEQIAVLVGAIVGLLQVLTVAIGVWNKIHISAIRDEQAKVAANLALVNHNGKELATFLEKSSRK